MIFLVTTCIVQKGSKLQVLFPPKLPLHSRTKIPDFVAVCKNVSMNCISGGPPPCLEQAGAAGSILHQVTSTNRVTHQKLLLKFSKWVIPQLWVNLPKASIICFCMYILVLNTLQRQGNNLSMEKSFTLQLPVQTSLMWHRTHDVV